MKEYCRYIQKNEDIIEKVDGMTCASVLDGIGDPLKTYQNQKAMEGMGVVPLPCFHYGEDERYLDYYAANYPYITIGGMVPISTTAFPTMTRRASANDWSGYADEVGRVARSVVFLTVLSAAGLVALSAPLSRLVALGNASVQSVEVERAIAAFAVGLPGFAMVLFLTRASYARRVVRTPTMVNVLVAAFGAVIMLGLVQVVEPGWRIAILGLGNALAQSVGAVLLTVELRTDLIARGQRLRGQLLPAMRVALAAVLAVGSCRWLVERLSPDQVVPALVAVVVGVAVVGAIGVAVVSLLGGPRPAALVASMGGATRS